MTKFKFSEIVTAARCLEFTRRDGRRVRVYPQTRGKIITPVEYSHLSHKGQHTGQVLVEWTGYGWFWCAVDDVKRVERETGR